jgi:ABC-2 type transport system ATP-binding protein
VGGDKGQIARALRIVHLEDAAERRVSVYSSGMRQRLGLALALLRDPELLILDEPTNRLDPAGIHEMRDLLSRLPEEHGVTVFLSSHLLTEVEQVATHIGIIQEGVLRFQGTLDELHAQMKEHLVVSVDRPERAREWLHQAGWTVRGNGGHDLMVAASGRSDAALINSQLVQGGVNVYRVSLQRPSLEDIFLSLTNTCEGGV